MSFLLDTDICSAYVKNNRLVANRFVQYGGRLHISTATLGELYTWAKRAAAPAKRLQGVLDLLKEVQVLPMDDTSLRRLARFGLLYWTQDKVLPRWT